MLRRISVSGFGWMEMDLNLHLQLQDVLYVSAGYVAAKIHRSKTQ